MNPAKPPLVGVKPSRFAHLSASSGLSPHPEKRRARARMLLLTLPIVREHGRKSSARGGSPPLRGRLLRRLLLVRADGFGLRATPAVAVGARLIEDPQRGFLVLR